MAKIPTAGLARQIKVATLNACCEALSKLNYRDKASFTAGIQIALVGADISASELGRALNYDPVSITEWSLGARMPPQPVARREALEIIRKQIEQKVSEWSGAFNAVESIRKIRKPRLFSQP